MAEKNLRFCFPFPEKLFLCRSAYRTCICARTAADALVSVNNVFAVTLGNATGRASVGACAAADALVRNLVCHLTNLHFSYRVYSIIFMKKIKYILKKTTKNLFLLRKQL